MDDHLGSSRDSDFAMGRDMGASSSNSKSRSRDSSTIVVPISALKRGATIAKPLRGCLRGFAFGEVGKVAVVGKAAGLPRSGTSTVAPGFTPEDGRPSWFQSRQRLCEACLEALDASRSSAEPIPMPSTFTCLNYHVIFGTKRREHWIEEKVRERLWPYLGGVIRERGCVAHEVGGATDHAHMLVSIPPTMAVSEAMQAIKGVSSRWLHQTFPKLEGAAWQDGYAAFSVSKSGMAEVRKYIKSQMEHHRSVSFYDEYKAFLVRHEVEFDERYLL